MFRIFNRLSLENTLAALLVIACSAIAVLAGPELVGGVFPRNDANNVHVKGAAIAAHPGNSGTPATDRQASDTRITLARATADSAPDSAAAATDSDPVFLLPRPRPAPEEIYPTTARTLEKGFRQLMGFRPRHETLALTLEEGEGLAQLLARGGLTGTEAQNAITRISDHISPRRMRVGYAVEIIPPATTQERAAFLPAIRGHGPAIRLALPKDRTLTLIAHEDRDTEWVEEISLRPIRIHRQYVGGVIDSSLYKSGIEAGMNDSVLDRFVSVFGFTVDFQREIRKGDGFEVLFETKEDLISGEVTTNPAMHYIALVLSGKRTEFFRHNLPGGGEGWYDAKGENAAKGLMRTPVNGARLSSGYGMRRHPILGYNRAHRGTDFAAPTGTPVMAAGNGVVEVAGRNGAYGKYIRIRHHNGYKTAYAHLSRIHVSRGMRVAQGQVIGRIGSTGRSTGPHLHYEIHVNNRQVNPMTIPLPAGKPLPESAKGEFFRKVAALSIELEEKGSLRLAEAQ